MVTDRACADAKYKHSKRGVYLCSCFESDWASSLNQIFVGHDDVFQFCTLVVQINGYCQFASHMSAYV